MAGELPPVVTDVLLNYDPFIAGADAIEDRVKRLMGYLEQIDGSTDKAAAGLKDVGDTAEKAAGSLTTITDETDTASAGLDRVGEAGTAASAGLDETAASADRASSALARTDAAGAGKGFEKVGEDAAGMGGKVSKAAKDVEKAEQDTETRSGGFSSKISSLFTHVGETMGNWGLPFSESVTKMGEQIDEAEQKGKGFQASMVAIGKTATMVGGVALVGLGAEGLHTADDFDVASTQMDNAIKNVGGSVSALTPQIENTYTKMEKLGFNQQQVAESMQALTIATKDPTKAMQDETVAADLARAKHQELSAATQTLTKVYAGSTRALTQLGINIDVGSGKLKSIQSATESVTNAQLAYKTAQNEATIATGEKAVSADAKLEAAHLKLEQAELKLRQDHEATGDILNVVQQRTEGAAKAFGTTLAGQIDAVNAKTHNLSIAFGEFLTPALTAVIGVLNSFFSALVRGNPIIIGIASVIGGVLVLAIASYIASLTKALVLSAAGFVKMAAEAAASAATQVAAWLGVGTAANTAATETGAAETKMVAEVEAGDTAIEAANATVALSFTGIGTAAVAAGAVVYGAVKGMEAGLTAITGEAQKLNTLLGGNQPGEASKEGEGIAKAFNNKYSTGLKHQMGSSLGELGSGVEEEILKTAMAHGLSPAAAAAMVGNAAQESSLSPGAPGGGLYQMSGYPGRGTGNAQNQTEEAIQLMGSSVIAMMNAAKSPAEAANIMMKDWEKPKGSQPGEEASAGIANAAHREQAAREAALKIEGAIAHTAPTSLTTATKGVKTALEATKAKEAQKGIAEALATAKAHIAELKATFATAWSELAKTAEKIFKMMQAKGGIKAHELLGMEGAHEAEEARVARASAEENVRKAEAGEGVKEAHNELEVDLRKETEAVNKLTDAENKLATAEKERRLGKGSKSTVESAQAGVESAKGAVTNAKEATAGAIVAVSRAEATQRAEIKSAREALNNTLYQEKVNALKKESKAEETAIAKENAAKQAAFTAALNQLKAHLAKGKTTSEQATKDIEKVFRKFGVTMASVGKDAGTQWVKQFEEAIKRAAKDSGALSAEISADIKAGVKIPGLAVGGIVTAPTLAMIGEAGPEAVVPLNQLGGIGALGGGVSPLPPATGSVAAGTRGGLTVGEINLYGQNATSAELVRELYYQLRPMLVTS